MDFVTTLHTAQQNQPGRNGCNYYKTKFEPQKKEVRSKKLSANIKKFLAKKEEEEHKKSEELRRKRDELLSMRDTKATNKIKKMLKVIKSANKSVLDDAVDNVNTAVTINGPDQPDEDDYGYVSQEASAFYSKMMEKYKNIPDEEKFTTKKSNINVDLMGTKDRVRAAIMRQQEEELLPHKRKRKSHHLDDTSNSQEEQKKEADKKDEKPKPKRPMPPPLDFSELLKIAEKKQYEPIIIETKKNDIPEEPERLMTKKQKREYEEMKAYKEDRIRREKERERMSSLTATKSDSKLKSALTNKQNNSLLKIPKIGEKANIDNLKKNILKNEPPLKSDDKNKYRQSVGNNDHSKSPVNSKIVKNKESLDKKEIYSKMKSERSPTDSSKAIPKHVSKLEMMRPSISSNKMPVKSGNVVNPTRPSPNEHKMYNNYMEKKMNENERSFKNSNYPKNIKSTGATERVTSNNKVMSPSNAMRPTKNTNIADNKMSSLNTSNKSKPIASNSIQKTKQLYPSGVKKTGQFPHSDAKRPREESLKREKMKKRRIVDDDDSEYDSSLDDFIDDGPEEGADVSSYIKQIFGYDKSKYKDYDDDDANMESNFSQVMKEEYISKKIGLMEDLEDMKQEALEKKRKMMKNQKRS